MSNYGIFARYYDKLCENVNYEVRSDYISGFFNAEGINSGSLLDIACGTGGFSKCFSDKGYAVTGIDISSDMLTLAQSKCPDSSFIQTDMRSFAFDEPFDCAVCCLDSLNHLENLDDWALCFKCAASSLRQGGIFVFDVNTVYKHNYILSDNSFIFDEEDFFLAWDNEGEGDNRVKIFLDFFIFNGKSYDRYSEEFCETAFETEKIKALLTDDFKLLGVYDDLTLNAEKPDSERLYFVLKRK